MSEISINSPAKAAILDVLDQTLWTASASSANKELLAAALVAVTQKSSPVAGDAEIVVAALDTGEWVLERVPHQDVVDGERCWFIKRNVAPFCAVHPLGDKRGPYGPRYWYGPTALATLKTAAADLGLTLPGLPAQPATARKRTAREKLA